MANVKMEVVLRGGTQVIEFECHPKIVDSFGTSWAESQHVGLSARPSMFTFEVQDKQGYTQRRIWIRYDEVAAFRATYQEDSRD